ncbi:hypothetical protein MC885_009013, partial [Smutsia gigantea]
MGAWTSLVKVTADSKGGTGGGAQGHTLSSQYSQWVLDAPGPRALGRKGTDPDLARPPGRGALGLLVVGTSFAAFRGLHWGPQLLPTPGSAAWDRSKGRTSVSPWCTARSRGPERCSVAGLRGSQGAGVRRETGVRVCIVPTTDVHRLQLSLYPQMAADPVHGRLPWVLVMVAAAGLSSGRWSCHAMEPDLGPGLGVSLSPFGVRHGLLCGVSAPETGLCLPAPTEITAAFSPGPTPTLQCGQLARAGNPGASR